MTNRKTNTLATLVGSKAAKVIKAKPTAKKPATKAPAKKRLTDAEKDKITVVKASQDQHYIVVVSADNEMFTRPIYGDSKEFRAIAQIGSSFNAAQRWNDKNQPVKPNAKLARGLDARTAPQSAKAVRDQKPQPEAKAAKAKGAAPKAAKNKAPSRGVDRTYVVNKKAENKARPDSWRHHMTAMIMSATDTASAKANHAKSGKFSANKLDFNWAANNGFITYK